MAYNEGQGKESEWNEAMLKARRLNDIQERLNIWKVSPLGITDGKFNYVFLLKDIENLYGEGRSKYSDKEKKEIDALRVFCNKTLRLMPPHTSCKKDSLTKNSVIQIFNEKNFEMLSDLLYAFEMKVKDYNDDHGLTTRNKGTTGLFG